MRRKSLTTLLLSASVVFSLANTKPLSAAVKYTIGKGDSLWTIARKHDTHVRDILKANHIKVGEPLHMGMTIVVPAPKSAVKPVQTAHKPCAHPARIAAKPSSKHSKPAPKVAGTFTHFKISEGDSLWTIARHYSIHVKDIVAANNLQCGEVLKLGKVLVIPITASQKKQMAMAQHNKRVAQINHQKRLAQLRHKQRIASKAKRNWVAKHNSKSHHDKWQPIQVASADIGGSDRGSKVVRKALAYRGARYRRGGTSAAGFDCSGFTRFVYSRNGVSLPHSSRAQSHVGRPVGKGSLKAGDLVFFSTYRRGVSHVGIYIGGGRFVHAATYGRGVRTDSLGESYYCSRYRGARRVQ